MPRQVVLTHFERANESTSRQGLNGKIDFDINKISQFMPRKQRIHL